MNAFLKTLFFITFILVLILTAVKLFGQEPCMLTGQGSVHPEMRSAMAVRNAYINVYFYDNNDNEDGFVVDVAECHRDGSVIRWRENVAMFDARDGMDPEWCQYTGCYSSGRIYADQLSFLHPGEYFRIRIRSFKYGDNCLVFSEYGEGKAFAQWPKGK